MEYKKNWNTIVVGGGQAGLAAGYWLKKRNDDFIILDAAAHVGDAWRNRWASLRLFTPNWANAMPGKPFPESATGSAGKDEVADFLAAYARQFALPILSDTRVTSLKKNSGGYVVATPHGTFFCHHIILANGNYAAPKIPSFARHLDPEIKQLHSSGFIRPSELPAGDVLVVGAATSGIQIALDIAGSGRRIYLAGNPPFKIPTFILKYFGRQFIWAMNHVMTIHTKPGRKAEQAIKAGHGAPLINISIQDAERAGITHLPRLEGVLNGQPQLADGRVLPVSTIIWCTGFSTDFSWVHVPEIHDEHGYPLAYRGVSNTHPGLYFMGMTFQYALTSAWINGVGRDARYIVNHIHAQHAKASQKVSAA